MVQVHGQHFCCMAAWKTGATIISETSKRYPLKHQFHDGEGRERSLALSGRPGNQKFGWNNRAHGI